MKTKNLACMLGGLAGLLSVASCDLDVPDLNNPGLNEVEDTPTPANMSATATGVFIGNRAGKAPTVGYVNLLGILGRESYDFDPNDGRFSGEMITSNLSKSSPFGGSFWFGQYANIRNANLILNAIDKVVPPYSPTAKAALQGFAHTMQAAELIIVIATHDDTGAVIDTNHPVGDPLGPVVSKAAVYTEIYRLLDLAKTELEASGGDDSSFPFTVAPGFATFASPAATTGPNFIKFNRALKARALSYQAPANKALYADMVTALNESFINDTATTINFTTGASYTFSNAAGDTANALTNRNIYAHPSIGTDVHKGGDGMPDDARYLAKVIPIDFGGSAGAAGIDSLKTTIRFRNLGARTVNKMDLPPDSPRMYANTTSIPFIRNEDLILLKAEALWFTGDKDNALIALNKVRQGSGKLPALAAPADDTAFVDALLYEREYSLLFEGGHRWLDLRRFGRPLPLAAPDQKQNLRFPIPLPECDARPGEAACDVTSSDPPR
jgi:hypothetical protein